MDSIVKSTLRVKIKSLAAESKMIRQEIKRNSRSVFAQASLMSHRANVVVPEIRAALWAYAYLRNRPLDELEGSTKSHPAVLVDIRTRAKRILKRYTDFSEDNFNAWFAFFTSARRAA